MINPNKNPQQPTQADQQKQQDRNRQRGTGFTNINKVLGANVGAGKQMGQKIGSSLSGQAGAIKEGIEQGKAGFQAGMQSGAEQANKAIGGAQQAFQGVMQSGQQPTQGQLGQQPTQGQPPIQGQPAQTQPNEPDYEKIGEQLRGAAYQGPQGMEKAGQLTSQAATASALAKLGGTAGGQQQLLASQVAGRGGYGSGHSALDRMLLSKGGQQEIQRGRSALTGIEGAAQGAVQGAQQQATAQAAAIEGNRAAATKQIQEGLTGEQGINTLAAKQAQDYGTKAARLKEIISGQQSGADYVPQTGDEDILNNAAQFGAQDAEIYEADPTAYKTSLGSLANSMVTDFSGKKMYQGQQQKQAENIAKLLSDKQSLQEVQGNTFDPNVFQAAFKPGDTNRAIFNPMQEAKQKDEKSLSSMKQRQSDANELAQLGSDGQVNNRLYDLLESFAPGARSEIDKLPNNGIRKEMYAKVARELGAKQRSKYGDKSKSQSEKIKSNTKNLFSSLKERITGKK